MPEGDLHPSVQYYNRALAGALGRSFSSDTLYVKRGSNVSRLKLQHAVNPIQPTACNP